MEKGLLPFINQHRQDSNYSFWSDLAGAHYSNLATEWMNEHVNFVDFEEFNPPNVPQARPVESFWAKLGQKCYDNDWEANAYEQLAA